VIEKGKKFYRLLHLISVGW